MSTKAFCVTIKDLPFLKYGSSHSLYHMYKEKWYDISARKLPLPLALINLHQAGNSSKRVSYLYPTLYYLEGTWYN